MEKIIELAKQAGIEDAYFVTPHPGVLTQLQSFYTLCRADLEAENAKLRDALNDLRITAPKSPECHHFHHDTNHQHGLDDECGPVQEYLNALKAARAALGETK